MKNIVQLACAAALGLAATAADAATTVKWVDWTSVQPNQGQNQGPVLGNVAGVGVRFDGARSFVQITGGGTDYWVTSGTGVVGAVPFTLPTSYTQGLVNRPVGTDIIALNVGGLKTITFSRPVKDVFFAMQSWNTNAVTFDRAFNVVSQGAGFWGTGAFNPNGTNTAFAATGEANGIIRFSGPVTSLSFTDTTENWHGFTVGISAVPEPQSWAMLIAGFGLIGAAMRRRRVVAA